MEVSSILYFFFSLEIEPSSIGKDKTEMKKKIKEHHKIRGK